MAQSVSVSSIKKSLKSSKLWLTMLVILSVCAFGFWVFHPAFPNLPHQKLQKWGCNAETNRIADQEETYEVIYSFNGARIELFYKSQRETLHQVETEIAPGNTEPMGLTFRGPQFEYFDNAEDHLYGPNGLYLTPSCR